MYVEPQAPTELVSVGLTAECWYAVQTRSRFEKAVGAELSAWGIEHFLATFQDVHQWKDRKKVVEVPLFSGYIFVRLQDTESARLQVLKTNGIVRILGTGGQIEQVPDFEIESIRQLLGSGKQCYPHPFVREGSWVRMRRGPLAGVEGRLIRVKSQTRLVLSVQLLSQSVATEVDAWDVVPIRERRP